MGALVVIKVLIGFISYKAHGIYFLEGCMVKRTVVIS